MPDDRQQRVRDARAKWEALRLRVEHVPNDQEIAQDKLREVFELARELDKLSSLVDAPHEANMMRAWFVEQGFPSDIRRDAPALAAGMSALTDLRKQEASTPRVEDAGEGMQARILAARGRAEHIGHYARELVQDVPENFAGIREIARNVSDLADSVGEWADSILSDLQSEDSGSPVQATPGGARSEAVSSGLQAEAISTREARASEGEDEVTVTLPADLRRRIEAAIDNDTGSNDDEHEVLLDVLAHLPGERMELPLIEREVLDRARRMANSRLAELESMRVAVPAPAMGTSREVAQAHREETERIRRDIVEVAAVLDWLESAVPA